MSDFKSKLPDFKELSSMTSKLYKGIKTSVEEIIQDYKQKRVEAEVKAEEEMKKPTETPISPAASTVTPESTLVTPPVVETPVTPVESTTASEETKEYVNKDSGETK